MTTHIHIPDISPVIQASGNGSQKVFAFPFPIFYDSDLEVRVGTAVLISGFTVFGAGSSKGGAVVFASAPANGSRVTLRRKQTYARTDDFLDERAPTPHELNDAVDQNVAAIQELAEQASRAVQLPLSADLSLPVSLDLPAPEANKVLGWNGAANGLVNIAQIDPSNVLHRDQNLADLLDKAAARSNLGLGSAATHAASDFATAAQGAKADSALQPADIGGSVQAHDADLDWLAANLSPAGRALIDDADASAQRTTLGLATVAASGSYTDLSGKPNLGSAATHAASDFATAAQGAKADSALQPADIGGSVQAHDADLDWLAANLSPAGRALIDDADASAQRTTLGLATVAASGSYTDLSGKPSLGSAAALNVDTDPTLAANSDSLLPSQKAVKAYADAKVATILTSTSVASLEQDVAQTYLRDAMLGGWSAGNLANGLYDTFTSDTIGANATGQTYDGSGRFYYPTPSSYSSDLFSGGTALESGHYGSNVVANAFDGNTTTFWQGQSAATAGVNWLGYQLTSAAALTKIGVYVDNIHEVVTEFFDLQYSSNGVSWSNVATGLAFPNTGWTYFTFAHIGAYAYWRIVNQNTNAGCPCVNGFQGFTTQSLASMTLVSNALSPAPSTAPSLVKLMVLYKANDTTTLNTDFIAEATRDGSTWTAGTLSDTGYTANGYTLLWAVVDVSGQPSGANVKYRLKTLNSKYQQVKGVALTVQ